MIMKTYKYIKSIALTLAAACCVSLHVMAEGEKSGGGYVDDPTAVVPEGSYVTFSTVYNGRRYYLGVDTVAAQAATPKDTVAWYEGPNYATMWVVGPNWSPTGAPLANKDYTRTIKSVWLAERVLRDRYLTKGPGTAGYSPLQLLPESSSTTMWHTEKDDREQSRYIQGFLYCFTDEMGVEVNRYLTYDPVYGFGRLYGTKPAASQRVSVWDRKTGSDLIYHMTPSTITFGYDVTHDTVKQPITSQVVYYENVDRFRSRYDHVDVFAHQSTPITDQQQLVDDYGLVGHFEWKSNPIDEAHVDQYNGHSKMKYYTITGYDMTDPENPVATWGWADTTMVWARKNGFRLYNNVWYDTIYAIGKSPIDRPTARFLRKPAGGGAPTEGSYVNHSDVLYTHFFCHEQEYRDSVNVFRQIFHRDSYTTMNTAATPNDHVFDYSKEGAVANPADTAYTFTISGDYESGHVVRAVNGNVVDEYIGESGAVNIAGLPCYRDTIWTDAEPPTVDHIDLYDTLRVEALNIDGTPCEWVVATYLPARNQIRVKIAPYNEDATSNRTAQIRYTYSYWHSSAKGDNVTDSRVIWITQKWKGADNAELYAFHHSGETDTKGLQAVHEKHNVFYAIPQEPLNLPLHRDHWGYYRWFNYEGAGHDKDPDYNSLWAYSVVPKNVRNAEFMPINHTTDAASRGRWDVIRDAAHPSNPQFAQDHFTKWTRTTVPAVNYPQSNDKTGKIACDVSDYYNIQTTATTGVGVDLASLTEPTLSYRQIFDIQPAKTRADQLAAVRGNGNGANWLERYTIVAPAGRAFSIQPQCPIAYRGSEEIDEEHLQYIYYFNPDPTGTVDPNMGADPGSNYDKAATYARIGKKYKTGDPTYRAQLLSPSDITIGRSKPVIMVNPRKGTGFVIGKNGSGFTTIDLPDSVYNGNATTLQHFIEDEFLNTTAVRDAFKMTLERPSTNEISIKNGNDYLQFDYSDGLLWTTASGRPDQTMDYSAAGNSSNYITSTQSTSVKLWMHAAWWLDIFVYREGYMMAYDYSEVCVRRVLAICVESRLEYNRDIRIQRNLEDDNDESNRGWLFYEIIEPDEEIHFETPRWEKSTDGTTWTQVAHWDYSAGEEGKGEGITDAPGYTMTADGALHIGAGVHTTVNAPILYRLRTEHFQLAKFTGITRPADTEMLKLGGDIISEEDIERDYDILYNLDMETWPAPGTNNVVAYNKPFPWDFTELSYHYPLSVIPEALRVDSTEMPGKGEYAFINKFIVPEGPTTENPGEEFECMEGADHGYMLCVNAAGKRATIMNFDFNELTCSGQQIYLVGNCCNPVNNSYEPEITADMEGSNDGGVTWTRIYRYKSGKIPYRASSGAHWHQMALPIARDSIAKYKRFRCRAEISGGSQRNAHLLIDRLRFIEKNRAFSVFQNKATCIKEDSVTVLIRLNYQSAPDLYVPGKLVAYQFQKWDKDANAGAGGYVPMLASKTTDGGATYTALDNTTTPKLEVFPGYLKDGFTAKESVEQPSLKSMTGNDYGYVMIPEANYDPSLSNTVGGRSAQRADLIEEAITKLGLTGDDATARRGFIDETGNIRTFDQIVSHDYNDWGIVEFGEIKTAHIKSFVKVDDTWLLYIVSRLPVSATDNNTFRIGMTVMNNLNDRPTFAEESCATFRILNIKQTTGLLVNGLPWGNATRAQAVAADTLLPANQTQRASIKLTVSDKVGTHNTKNPRCKFDMLHMTADARPGTTAGDAAFLAAYGCSRTQFVDDMEAFRIDDDRNVMRDITDWNLVTPEMFTYTGRTQEVATAIYNRLNHLIRDLHVLEIGLDYRDIYMGDRADSYFYLLPVPATGLFEVENGSSTGTDTTWNASVCNDTIWLELHSEEPQAKLRYGFDSRVGDTYIVPIIRSSLSDANAGLKVRVAEISTDPSYSVILGWQETELIESNDPNWTGMQIFNYQQDINMRGHRPSETSYYTKGDIVTFTPVAGHTINLKAGYWYRFKTNFYRTESAEIYPADGERTLAGSTQFILAIAPDTVRWTPEYAGKANYWNDDHNWTPVMYNTPEGGFLATVPMGDTKVIIPGVAEGLLPIASDVVEDQKDTLHYGYAKNTCQKILFKPRSQILGQEKLTYKTAYVDVILKTGEWQTYSSALDDIYSGDMYIPFSTSYNPSTPGSGASTDNEDFNPKSFPYGTDYSGSYNPRVYPFAIYQGFYNASVPVPFYNTDIEGTPVNNDTHQQSKSSVDWVKTPSLDMHYAPGSACVLLGYDETDADGNEIVVRLPKPNDAYNGFGKKDGVYKSGPAIEISRPDKLNRNLAYDQYADGFSLENGLSYTLTNATPSDIFFFGNPTMSLVDVYKLCVDNADVLKHEGGTYHFTAYKLIDGTSYTPKTIDGPGQFFIAPERAVGLIAASEGTSLTIKLKPSALVAVTGDGTIVSHEEIVNPAPQRRMANDQSPIINKKRLYITASNETDWGVQKSYLTLGEQADASRGYVYGEDALNIVSGLNYYSDESFSTPLSMYTIANNKALMQDVRDTLGIVPLVFTTLPDYSYSDFTFLSFYTDGLWDKPLYLYDALTGDSLLIRDGMEVAVRTPESDQMRYFINGYAAPQSGSGDSGVITGLENGGDNNQSPITNNQSGITVIYDVLGRCLMTLGEYDLISNIQLPTGVYIIQHGDKSERMVIR